MREARRGGGGGQQRAWRVWYLNVLLVVSSLASWGLCGHTHGLGTCVCIVASVNSAVVHAHVGTMYMLCESQESHLPRYQGSILPSSPPQLCVHVYTYVPTVSIMGFDDDALGRCCWRPWPYRSALTSFSISSKVSMSSPFLINTILVGRLVWPAAPRSCLDGT